MATTGKKKLKDFRTDARCEGASKDENHLKNAAIDFINNRYPVPSLNDLREHYNDDLSRMANELNAASDNPILYKSMRDKITRWIKGTQKPSKAMIRTFRNLLIGDLERGITVRFEGCVKVSNDTRYRPLTSVRIPREFTNIFLAIAREDNARGWRFVTGAYENMVGVELDKYIFLSNIKVNISF